MEKWEKSELNGYEWFKQNYDSAAVLCGQYDSTQSDIYSPLFGSYIEIKQLCPSARCGQFTQTTAFFSLCQDVMSGIQNEQNAKEFVRLHYSNKQVTHFLVITQNNYKLESLEAFLNNHHFEWQVYAKKSGTRKVAKKYYEKILNMIPSEIKDNDIYVTDDNLVEEYFWIDDVEFFISKKNYKQIRQCSKTKNQTWLVKVEE